MINKKLGRLTPISEYYKGKYKYVECQCDCGNIKSIRYGDLTAPNRPTRSCGCIVKENAIKRNYKHGLTGHRLHNIWNGMVERCNNPNSKDYVRYGKRGIKICSEWLDDFKVFYDWAKTNGYKKNLTIDRKDNNDGYNPDNCRWVTSIVNSQNTRTTKLNWDLVWEIRNAYNLGCFYMKGIAQAYGISTSQTQRIIRLKRWT